MIFTFLLMSFLIFSKSCTMSKYLLSRTFSKDWFYISNSYYLTFLLYFFSKYLGSTYYVPYLSQQIIVLSPQPPFVNKVFFEAQPCPFVYLLSMAAFALQEQG